MARGTQLEELIYMLRAEVGQSTLVAAGIDNLPALKQILNRNQDMLADDYDWPFLEFQPFKNLAAGQRYYDLPTGLKVEGIENVVLWYNDKPQEIIKGIGADEYSQYSSDDDERASPVMRWDIKNPTGNINGEQVEVWPLPDDNTQQLQFFGKRSVSRMVEDSDRCTLDDILIVLTSAAEILARQESADAAAKKAMADERRMQLRARYQAGSEPIIMGGGLPSQRSQSLRGKTIIRVS